MVSYLMCVIQNWYLKIRILSLMLPYKGYIVVETLMLKSYS